MNLNSVVKSWLLLVSCVVLLSGSFAGEAETVDLTKPDPKAADALIQAQVKALIEKLGAGDTVQREDAEKALTAIGAPAAAQLKEASTSANAEIAIRAKRVAGRLTPVGAAIKSYAEALPADSVFFLELADAQGFMQKIKESPLGRFWETPQMKKFIQGYRKDLLATEIQTYDAMNALAKNAKGKAVLALGSPTTIQVEEIDPPLTYIVETDSLQASEAQAKLLFDGMGDPIKSKRIFKQFTIDEQANANTLFAQGRMIHALTEKGMDAILDGILKPPAQTLESQLGELKKLRPNADWTWRISSSGFKNLVEALQIIDQEQVDTLNAAGFIEGSSIEGLGSFNAEGVDEITRIVLAGGDKNKGVLGLMQRLAPSPERDAKKPQALDMIPFQAAMVLTLNADVAKDAEALSVALTTLDRTTGSIIKENQLPNDKPLDDKNKNTDPGLSPAAKALGLGGGITGNDTPAAPGVPNKPKTLERTAPHIDNLQKSGIQLKTLLEQVDGPMYVALFPEQVDVTRVTIPNAPNPPPDPEHIPMSAVFTMCVKDPKVLEERLVNALHGIKPAFKRLEMNGGTLFVDAQEEEDESPAFWLSQNFFAYGTSRDVLELATSAALNAKGNQRITARPEFQKHIAQRGAEPVLIDIFADSTLFLDMPYKMTQLSFTEATNPLPDYGIAAKFLKDNLIHISMKQVPGGLQINSKTPVTWIGLFEALRRPLVEALLWQ